MIRTDLTTRITHPPYNRYTFSILPRPKYRRSWWPSRLTTGERRSSRRPARIEDVKEVPAGIAPKPLKGNNNVDSNSSEQRPPRVSLQFSLAFLLTITLIAALGSLAARQLLIAWETPRQRAAFAVLVIMLPTLSVCVLSLLYRVWRRLNR